MNAYLAFGGEASYPTALIKQGMHWRLLFLGPIGFLLSGCWIAFAISACISAVVLRFTGPAGLFYAYILNLVLAVFAAEIMGWEIRLKGGVLRGVWLGRSMADARLRAADSASGAA